jgi:hypothetical protein
MGSVILSDLSLTMVTPVSWQEYSRALMGCQDGIPLGVCPEIMGFLDFALYHPVTSGSGLRSE